MSTSLAQRSKPAYDNLEMRALGEQLEDARAREHKLHGAGIQTDEVRREILELRRKLRDGGLLRAGADLGDGRYLLIQQVGRGGFAVVWDAHDRKEDRRVAIKVLHNHLAGDQQRRERFFRGARVMLQFEHPAVVRVLDSHGEDEHFCYFVMELLPGGNLRDAILEKRVEPSRVLPLVLQVGEALAEAHRRGLVHRDIKPANILLDEVGNAKLTDFDLVGAHDTTGGTRTGALGTVVYAAPECLDKPQLATPRADVFGLAMTAIFCLSGRDLSMSTFRDPTAALGHLDCAPGVREVLARASAWEPGDRYPDAAALVDALRSVLSEAEVTGDTLMLSPEEASKAVAEIRAIAEQLGADSAYSDELSAEELGDAWPLLGLDERCDGLRVLPREDAENFFIALPATDQLAILLRFRPGLRRQWIRLLEPDDIIDVLQEAGDEHRSTLFHLLNAPTRKEVRKVLEQVVERTPDRHFANNAAMTNSLRDSLGEEVAPPQTMESSSVVATTEATAALTLEPAPILPATLAPSPVIRRTRRRIVIGATALALAIASIGARRCFEERSQSQVPAWLDAGRAAEEHPTPDAVIADAAADVANRSEADEQLPQELEPTIASLGCSLEWTFAFKVERPNGTPARGLQLVVEAGGKAGMRRAVGVVSGSGSVLMCIHSARSGDVVDVFVAPTSFRVLYPVRGRLPLSHDGTTSLVVCEVGRDCGEPARPR